MILENVEKRVRDNDTPYYVFTLDIIDENNNRDILTFFSNNKGGLNFTHKEI